MPAFGFRRHEADTLSSGQTRNDEAIRLVLQAGALTASPRFPGMRPGDGPRFGPGMKPVNGERRPQGSHPLRIESKKSHAEAGSRGPMQWGCDRGGGPAADTMSFDARRPRCRGRTPERGGGPPVSWDPTVDAARDSGGFAASRRVKEVGRRRAEEGPQLSGDPTPETARIFSQLSFAELTKLVFQITHDA